MSPVSRKRKPKKQPRTQRTETWAPPAPRSWPWWPQAIAQVLADAESLLTVDDAPQLEQATAELIGGVLHGELQRQQSGFALNAWLDTLIAQIIATPGPPTMRLLHGIAAIAPRPQAEHARRGIDSLHGRMPAEPGWVAVTPSIRPTGQVHLLRDAYGSRFGVILECGYPNSASYSSAYLLDIDMCAGVSAVVDAHIHAEPEQARAAWQNAVGPSADSAIITPADPQLLGDLLPSSSLHEPGVMGDETRRLMDNYHRMVRRSDDLREVLVAAGTPLPEHRRWIHEMRQGLDIEGFVKDFQGWTTIDGTPVDDDTLMDLADAWLEGSLPETRLASSPHRIRLLQERIAIEWPQDAAASAAELLPTWVRWCAERTQLSPELAAHALAAAHAGIAARPPRRHDRDAPRSSTPVPNETHYQSPTDQHR